MAPRQADLGTSPDDGPASDMPRRRRRSGDAIPGGNDSSGDCSSAQSASTSAAVSVSASGKLGGKALLKSLVKQGVREGGTSSSLSPPRPRRSFSPGGGGGGGDNQGAQSPREDAAAKPSGKALWSLVKNSVKEGGAASLMSPRRPSSGRVQSPHRAGAGGSGGGGGRSSASCAHPPRGKALWGLVKNSVNAASAFHQSPLQRAGSSGHLSHLSGLSSVEAESAEAVFCEKFLTCPSLALLRRTLAKALAENKKACCIKDPSSGRLPLHNIGLNRDLIIVSTGGSAASIAQIDDFIIQEIISVHPSAIVAEDRAGHIPFTEVIVRWIKSRRATRKLMMMKQGRMKSMAASTRQGLGARSMRMIKRLSETLMMESDSVDDEGDDGNAQDFNRPSFSVYPTLVEPSENTGSAREDEDDEVSLGSLSRNSFSNILDGEATSDDDDDDEDEEVHDLPPMVEWSLRMLSAIVELPTVDMDQLGCSASKMKAMHDSANSLDTEGGISGSVHQSRKLRKLQHTLSLVSFDEVVVEKVAKIPHLIEELLLIEDKAARTRVFDLPFMHKVLFNEESLGDGKWFMDMLTRGVERNEHGQRVHHGSQMSLLHCGGNRSARSPSSIFPSAGLEAQDNADAAVFYLESISSLNLVDDLHVSHNLRSQKGGGHPRLANSDLRHYKRKRNRLYDAVGGLKGLIRTLCVLEGDLMSRAASTPVIQRTLDKKMFSPFAMTQALFNGLIHVIIVVTFRLGPGPAMLHLSPKDTWFCAQQYLIANMLLMASVLYCLKTETQVAIAKYSLSPRLFWSDALTFWKFLDVVPLFMILFCVVSVDCTLRNRALQEVGEDAATVTTPFALRAAVVLTTPLLWLRILGHIKMWNLQLATFILSSVEIMKEIKWFLVVLLVAMASFSQMFVSLSYEPSEDMRYQSFSLQGYLKAYTMMLGDFDTLSSSSNPSLVFLFIVYTFGVTIVLLNILIAIVSDAYANSTVSSKKLLAQARIMFVSEMSAFNKFHRMNQEGTFGSLNTQMNAGLTLLAAVLTLSFVWTVEAKDERMGRYDVARGARAYEALLLFAAFGGFIWLMRSSMVDILLMTWCPKGRPLTAEAKAEWMNKYYTGQLYDLFSNGIDFLQDNDDSRLLKESNESLYEVSDAKSGGKMTKQRLYEVQKTLAGSRKELKAEIKHATEELSMKLQEVETSSNKDMAKLEKRLTSTMADMIAASEQRLIQAISAMAMEAEDDESAISIGDISI